MSRRLYLLGGTGFARVLSEGLERAGYPVRMSVATELGREEVTAPPAGGIQVGPLDREGLLAELAAWGPQAVVDATHPYAVVVSRLAREAAAEAGLPLVRAERPDWVPAGEAERLRLFPDADALAQALQEDGLRPFFTVGAKGLAPFAGRGLRLAARVLPTEESVAAALGLGVDPHDLIAAYPPYPPEFTAACLRKLGCDVMVSKESGSEGGLDDKLRAAELAGVPLFVLGRPAEGRQGGVCHDLLAVLTRLEETWKAS